jgi:heme o synthase
MRTMTTVCPETSVLASAGVVRQTSELQVASFGTALSRARLTDYLELTKPRVAVLVLFTVAMGALLAPGGLNQPVLVLHTLIGTALVAAGASALNQLLERHSDAQMRRTENRPLPSGRLQPVQALLFGSCLGLAGILYMAVTLHHPWAALAAGLTFVSYAFIYTPLKRLTIYNTLIGAVPGAMPPVIGWLAIPDSLSVHDGSCWKLLALFLVLFVWQVPHFMAIAWIYREDYARAGLRMVPVEDPQGRLTGRHMAWFSLALIPVSLMPVFLGVAGPLYLLGALALGLMFLRSTLAFQQCCSLAQARRVLRASLVYLPALLALLLLDLKCGWN